MKTLMLTTALASAVAFSAAAQTAMETNDATAGAGANIPAFLAGDVIGMSLHALDSDGVSEIGADATDADRDRLRWTSSDAFLADRDDWEDVGAIDDIVMTTDGETRGFLVDVGGFLGFGARTVMIDIQDVYFVSDDATAEDVDDFHMVVAMSSEQLEGLPEFEREDLRAGFEGRPRTDAGAEDDEFAVDDDAMDDDDFADAAPMDDDAADATMAGNGTDMAGNGMDTDVMGDGFATLEADERTADRLLGADVYDAHGENIGNVDDVVLGDDDRITEVIVDVGGFLGIGAHTVALPIHDANIGWHDEDDEVRVQVSMTGDQLEALPEYDG